jgi:hypothetical protein
MASGLGCVGPLTEANRASSSFSCSSAFSGLLFLRGGKERGLRALVCMVRQHSCVHLMHVHGPRPELAHSSCRALDHVQNNSQHKAGGAGGCAYARVVGWFIRHARTHAGCATVDNLLRRHGPHGVEWGRGRGQGVVSVRHRLARERKLRAQTRVTVAQHTRRQPQTVQSERVSPHLRQPGVAQQAHLHLARPRRPSPHHGSTAPHRL